MADDERRARFDSRPREGDGVAPVLTEEDLRRIRRALCRLSLGAHVYGDHDTAVTRKGSGDVTAHAAQVARVRAGAEGAEAENGDRVATRG